MELGNGTKSLDEVRVADGVGTAANACVFPRRLRGAIPPFLIPSFVDEDPEIILIAATKAIHNYAGNLDGEAKAASGTERSLS